MLLDVSCADRLAVLGLGTHLLGGLDDLLGGALVGQAANLVGGEGLARILHRLDDDVGGDVDRDHVHDLVATQGVCFCREEEAAQEGDGGQQGSAEHHVGCHRMPGKK